MDEQQLRNDLKIEFDRISKRIDAAFYILLLEIGATSIIITLVVWN